MQTIRNVRKKYLLGLAIAFILVCYSIKRSISRMSTEMRERRTEQTSYGHLSDDALFDAHEMSSQEVEDQKMEQELSENQDMADERFKNEKDMIKNLEMQALEDREDRQHELFGQEFEENELEKHDYHEEEPDEKEAEGHDYHGQVIEELGSVEHSIESNTPEPAKPLGLLDLFFRKDDSQEAQEVEEIRKKLAGASKKQDSDINETVRQEDRLQFPIDNEVLPESVRNLDELNILRDSTAPEKLQQLEDRRKSVTLSAPVLVQNTIKPEMIQAVEQQKDVHGPNQVRSVQHIIPEDGLQDIVRPYTMEVLSQPADVYDPNHPDPISDLQESNLQVPEQIAKHPQVILNPPEIVQTQPENLQNLDNQEQVQDSNHGQQEQEHQLQVEDYRKFVDSETGQNPDTLEFKQYLDEPKAPKSDTRDNSNQDGNLPNPENLNRDGNPPNQENLNQNREPPNQETPNQNGDQPDKGNRNQDENPPPNQENPNHGGNPAIHKDPFPDGNPLNHENSNQDGNPPDLKMPNLDRNPPNEETPNQGGNPPDQKIPNQEGNPPEQKNPNQDGNPLNQEIPNQDGNLPDQKILNQEGNPPEQKNPNQDGNQPNQESLNKYDRTSKPIEILSLHDLLKDPNIPELLHESKEADTFETQSQIVAEEKGAEEIKVYFAESEKQKMAESGRLKKVTDDLKTILYWNDAYSNKGFFFGFGQEPFLRAGCKINACYATYDRTMFDLEDIDALIWHIKSHDQTLPTVRSPHTFYVLWMIESSAYDFTTNILPFNDKFNWTFTTRSDSDFPHPSGIIHYGPPTEEEEQLAEEVSSNFAEDKTKLLATIVHECETPSQREVLISSIQEITPVDVYGECGTRECSANDGEECHHRIAQDFKFYLSFESVLCNDYITEDFFQALRYDLVPVVYGLGYQNLDLPPKSHINVFDFGSLNELVDFLKYLDRNDTAYNEYFSWKKDISKISIGTWENSEITDKNFCDMCEKLHLADKSSHPDSKMYHAPDPGIVIKRPRDMVIDESYRKTYPNMYDWLVEEQCVSPASDDRLKEFISSSSEDTVGMDPLSHLVGKPRKRNR
uniref:Fucosyltransferase n=2 Tax=Hirondellea gigas TaxID=1518452 RepID=A0A2P2HYE3_9CRUS